MTFDKVSNMIYQPWRFDINQGQWSRWGMKYLQGWLAWCQPVSKVNIFFLIAKKNLHKASLNTKEVFFLYGKNNDKRITMGKSINGMRLGHHIITLHQSLPRNIAREIFWKDLILLPGGHSWTRNWDRSIWTSWC